MTRTAATEVLLRVGTLALRACLDDSPSAKALCALLPLELSMRRWGDEYYGECGVDIPLSDDARQEMAVGDLAIWPAGRALCIFFGPTPASPGTAPRAVSPVNPIGALLDSPLELKGLGESILLKIERVPQPA